MAIMNGKINDRLVEPLWSYELTEDGGRITLRIPGLFNGKPDSPELFYNGRKHALLVRNKDRVLLVNDIPEEYREKLSSADEVQMIETDSHRSYTAKLKDGGSALDGISERSLGNHVHYPLHPFPMSTGSVHAAKKIDLYPPAKARVSVPGVIYCAFCDRRLDVFYADKAVIGGALTRVCLDCLAESDKVSGKLNLYPKFTPAFYVNGKKSPIWGAHCGRDSIYLGSLVKDDLSAELKKEIIENWQTDNNIFMFDDPEEIIGKFDSGRMSLHLFRCTECGRRFALAFEKMREELTDEEWEMIELLITVIGKEKEWEVSVDRHHRKCLWEREEDAPFVLEEGIRALKEAAGDRLDALGLPSDKCELLKKLFNEFT